MADGGGAHRSELARPVGADGQRAAPDGRGGALGLALAASPRRPTANPALVPTASLPGPTVVALGAACTSGAPGCRAHRRHGTMTARRGARARLGLGHRHAAHVHTAARCRAGTRRRGRRRSRRGPARARRGPAVARRAAAGRASVVHSGPTQNHISKSPPRRPLPEGSGASTRSPPGTPNTSPSRYSSGASGPQMKLPFSRRRASTRRT